jgi:hypothetical protein
MARASPGRGQSASSRSSLVLSCRRVAAIPRRASSVAPRVVAPESVRFRSSVGAVDATVWVFAVLAAVLTFAIAAGTIGREAHRLDAVAPRAVYLLEEAVDFVSDRLPPDSQARLTHAEVEALLLAHLRWLHEQGLQPDRAVDQRQDITDQVVISEDALVAYLLGAADEAGVELLDDVDAVNVVDAHLAYFDAIGAVGPQARFDDVI